MNDPTELRAAAQTSPFEEAAIGLKDTAADFELTRAVARLGPEMLKDILQHSCKLSTNDLWACGSPGAATKVT